MKVFSVDAETNGLYGNSFTIAATVRQDGVETAAFLGRCPDEFVTSEWVRENVLPALDGMPITHPNPETLEEAFWVFWMKHKTDSQCIAHCGSPVESSLFRRCIERNIPVRRWAGPFPLHEVGTALLMAGEGPLSVDTYMQKHNLIPQFSGVAHHPMYDATAAAQVWERLFS